ncbi:MAG: SUF system Fe-S cluster assembly protein [Cupriavidus necator]
MSMIDWLHKAKEHEDRFEAEPDSLEGRVIAALRTVYDPEIPVNIYDLGLIYQLSADEASGKVGIRMTLTAPGCPVAQTFPGVVEGAVMEASGVEEVEVELVWDPPWSRERMSEAARLELGLL